MTTYTYTVKVHIIGAIGRPPYTCTETVRADNVEQAASRTKRKLKAGTFPDVPLSDMYIQSIAINFD